MNACFRKTHTNTVTTRKKHMEYGMGNLQRLLSGQHALRIDNVLIKVRYIEVNTV